MTRPDRVGRLQRPHQRQPLLPAVQRGRRPVPALDRRRRGVPRRRAQLLHGREPHQLSARRAAPATTCTSTVQLLSHDAKRLHYFTAIHRADDDALVGHRRAHDAARRHRRRARQHPPALQSSPSSAQIAAHHDRCPARKRRSSHRPTPHVTDFVPATGQRVPLRTKPRRGPASAGALQGAGVEAGAQQAGGFAEPDALDTVGGDALRLQRPAAATGRRAAPPARTSSRRGRRRELAATAGPSRMTARSAARHRRSMRSRSAAAALSRSASTHNSIHSFQS